MDKSVELPKALKETTSIPEDIKQSISDCVDKVMNNYNVDMTNLEYAPYPENPKAPFIFIPYNDNGKLRAKLNINSLFDWIESLDKFNERIYNKIA